MKFIGGRFQLDRADGILYYIELYCNLFRLGPPNANVTTVLAQKLKEAEILAPINAKLKENQEIMERLNRL